MVRQSSSVASGADGAARDRHRPSKGKGGLTRHHRLPLDGGTVEIDSTPAHAVFMFSEREICTLDRRGRLVTAYDGRTHVWRGLTGRAVRKFTGPDHRKHIVALSGQEADGLVQHVQRRLRPLADRGVESELIGRALAYDPVEDRQAFTKTYSKIAILPPDQYLSIVLQVATGCAWNRCTFCDFYHEQRYRVRSPEKFQRHAENVRAFLGESHLLRRSLFLGDADILGVGLDRLANCIEIARESFPDRMFYGFCEAVSAARQPVEALAQLRRSGVRCLYVEGESGHDPLLEQWQKRSRSAHLAAAVEHLKAAGIHVGIIFLNGDSRTRAGRAPAGRGGSRAERVTRQR